MTLWHVIGDVLAVAGATYTGYVIGWFRGWKECSAAHQQSGFDP